MTSRPDPSARRILFIGNSFTSRHQMPRLVTDLAAAAEHPRRVVVESIVAGGASLRRHWNAGIAPRAIATEAWDYVVLQEQSTLPLKSPKRYHENVRLFAAAIARHRARPVLYLTWSRQKVPETQVQITAAVEEIGAEVGAQVVPVGSVWHTVLDNDPGLALYAEDGSHPSAAGSYLAALTFFVSLFGEPAAGWFVADRLSIDQAIAAKLHAYAWASRGPGPARHGPLGRPPAVAT